MPSLNDNISKETAFFLIAIALAVAIAALVGFGTDWRALSFSGISGGVLAITAGRRFQEVGGCGVVMGEGSVLKS